ncbi:MAG: ThiF family adenylyltransferase [Bacillota bacterium]|nr:ThiF family adenylyltransferase [Bacillota bacterium]
MDYLKNQKKVFTEIENAKLSKLVVLVAGCGGLGTNQAVILQRIGVKKIYLVDFDKIEVSNLNRQILYSYKDIGKLKAIISKEKLDKNMLKTEIIASIEKINKDYIIPDDVDIVFDALDNYKARVDLEEITLKQDIPLIHGGINSMYGQVCVITKNSRNRIKNLLNKNDKNEISSFLPTVSVVASLQINEGIKVYLNKEDILLNKILFVDLDNYEFTLVDI